jgi:hypothetical protein
MCRSYATQPSTASLVRMEANMKTLGTVIEPYAGPYSAKDGLRGMLTKEGRQAFWAFAKNIVSSEFCKSYVRGLAYGGS